MAKKVTLFIDISLKAQLKRREEEMEPSPGFSSAMSMYSAFINLSMNPFCVGSLAEIDDSLLGKFLDKKGNTSDEVFKVSSRVEASMRYLRANDLPIVRLEVQCFAKFSKKSLAVYAFDFDEDNGRNVDIRGFVDEEEFKELFMASL
ncbi:MAG: hypothetical protein V4690_01495 [Patescibacteria group bacterium]